jgi:hypothetical protein
VTLNLYNNPIRFTPDGKVSVIDAIQAVSNSNRARPIWESLRREHPDILLHCEDYSFQREAPTPVVTSDGWERVFILLPDYLLESHLP